MEEKFLAELEKNRLEAEKLGVRIRPVTTMAQVHKCLTGHRESDGFFDLANLGKLSLSLEALSVKKAYTAQFSDREANTALTRLLDAGYTFAK